MQQPSATLSKYAFIVRVLSACLVSLVPYPISEFFCFFVLVFFFRGSYFSGGVWRFFCCALVPGTLALDLPTLIFQRLVFLSHLSVTTEYASL